MPKTPYDVSRLVSHLSQFNLLLGFMLSLPATYYLYLPSHSPLKVIINKRINFCLKLIKIKQI